jgi:hypothetical protein
METMRRRLLFILGWLAAAVLTSVVASAAVAIAGGQVTDRPLRPLTAAEVEALATQPLPAAITTATPEPTESTTTLTTPDVVRELDPAKLDPDNPDLESRPTTGTDIAAIEGVDPETVADETDATRVYIVHLEGGSARIGNREGQVLLLWALPRPGFTVEHRFEDTGLTVIFTDTRRQSWLVATWNILEGTIVETFEGHI